MRDAELDVMFGRREMIKWSQRGILGVTLSDEAEREAPVRMEPHPTCALPCAPPNAERRTLPTMGG
jgi:hypothetical protein